MVTKAKTASKSRATKAGSRKSTAKSAKGTKKGSTVRSAAGKQLVIVESPAKARTVGQMLGNKYVVVASQGHVRDLPKSKIGVDIDNEFEPSYVIMRDKRSILSDLKRLSVQISRQ